MKVFNAIEGLNLETVNLKKCQLCGKEVVGNKTLYSDGSYVTTESASDFFEWSNGGGYSEFNVGPDCYKKIICEANYIGDSEEMMKE